MKLFNILQFLFVVSGICLSISAQSARSFPASSPSTEALVPPLALKEGPACEESGEVVILHLVELARLGDELNKFGGCGYRLEVIFREHSEFEDTATRSKFGVYLKRDRTSRYEYGWFLARSPGEAQTLANRSAGQGLYLKNAMTFVERACSESRERSDQESKESGAPLLFRIGVDTGAIFVFEGVVGSPKKKEYRIIDGASMRTRPQENKRQLDEHVAKGYRPVDLWYAGMSKYHYVVMEKDDEIKPTGEYIYLSKQLGTDKRLSRLAKEGYGVAVMGGDFGVLNRVAQRPVGQSYTGVSFHNDLTKWFSQLLAEGFLDVWNSEEWTGCDVIESEWFFVRPADGSKRGPEGKEYKLLTMWHFQNEYAAKKGWPPPNKTRFTEPQFDEVRTAFTDAVYDAVKEGYEIKIFSPSNGTSVLFERRKRP